MASPVTIIFANQPPEMGLITKDRYMVYELFDGELHLRFNGKEEFLKDKTKSSIFGFLED